MALPQPPSERSRQLLQAIWSMSWDDWPTLARSRHYLTVYSGFGEDEQESLLAKMPAGLLNDFGPGVRLPPEAEQELSLTVAGVAACMGTEKVLTLFVRFIQHAVTNEIYRRPFARNIYSSGRGSPDGSERRNEISATGFLRREQALPKFQGRKDRLLHQLRLVITAELALWEGISEFRLGDFTVTLDRRIRYFTDVQNLDDYWARRFKPWESSDFVPYPVAAASGTFDPDGRVRLLRNHPDLLAQFLLGRIFNCCGGLTKVVSCPAVDPDIHSSQIYRALLQLEEQGHIRLPDRDTSTGRPNVVLTSGGADYISALRRDWADHKLRDRAARDALLAWLYDKRTQAIEAFDTGEFFNDPRCSSCGQFFSLSEIDDAARYLQDKNLITGERTDWQQGVRRPRITAGGIDCIEQGDGVAEYGKEPAKTNISYTISGPVSGTNVSIGGNTTQHATVNTVDADSLKTLIQAVIEALPGLGFDAQLITETTGAANGVVAEIEQRQLDKPRLRAALEKVQNLLSRAGNQALAAVLNAAIDYERSKLGLPPAR
jgi:hypothetical protein